MGSIYKRKWKDKNGDVHESDVWWIKYYKDGKPIRESTESHKETEAKKLLKKREGDAVSGLPSMSQFKKLQFSELLNDLETDYAINGLRTTGDLKRRVQLHIKPSLGDSRATSITTAHIKTFIAERQAAGAGNGEINRELAAIKRAFNLAIEGRKILYAPYIPMLRESDPRSGFFERAEFEAVLSHLPAHVQPAIRFAYITGWRIKSEVLTLKWDQVDFDGEVVRLNPGTTKNRKAREFPFTKDLRAILKTQGEKANALLSDRGIVVEHVFFSPKTGARVKDFRKAWRNACLAAGLAESEEIGKRKSGKAILKITPRRIPHDFRRTAVRSLVRAGIPEKVAMEMTGHKTRSVFERYNIVSGSDLREAAKKLDEAAKKAMGTVAGTVAPETGTMPCTDLPLTTSKEMPGAGIEPARPSRGSGF